METVNTSKKLPWGMMLLFLVGGTLIAALIGLFVNLIQHLEIKVMIG